MGKGKKSNTHNELDISFRKMEIDSALAPQSRQSNISHRDLEVKVNQIHEVLDKSVEKADIRRVLEDNQYDFESALTYLLNNLDQWKEVKKKEVSKKSKKRAPSSTTTTTTKDNVNNNTPATTGSTFVRGGAKSGRGARSGGVDSRKRRDSGEEGENAANEALPTEPATTTSEKSTTTTTTTTTPTAPKPTIPSFADALTHNINTEKASKAGDESRSGEKVVGKNKKSAKKNASSTTTKSTSSTAKSTLSSTTEPKTSTPAVMSYSQVATLAHTAGPITTVSTETAKEKAKKSKKTSKQQPTQETQVTESTPVSTTTSSTTATPASTAPTDIVTTAPVVEVEEPQQEQEQQQEQEPEQQQQPEPVVEVVVTQVEVVKEQPAPVVESTPAPTTTTAPAAVEQPQPVQQPPQQPQQQPQVSRQQQSNIIYPNTTSMNWEANRLGLRFGDLGDDEDETSAPSMTQTQVSAGQRVGGMHQFPQQFHHVYHPMENPWDAYQPPHQHYGHEAQDQYDQGAQDATQKHGFQNGPHHPYYHHPGFYPYMMYGQQYPYGPQYGQHPQANKNIYGATRYNTAPQDDKTNAAAAAQQQQAAAQYGQHPQPYFGYYYPEQSQEVTTRTSPHTDESQQQGLHQAYPYPYSIPYYYGMYPASAYAQQQGHQQTAYPQSQQGRPTSDSWNQ